MTTSVRRLCALLLAGLLTSAGVALPATATAAPTGGTVVAWGHNDQGQTDVPPLPTGVTYTAIAAGTQHSLALRSDGTAVAWGRNDYGQADVPALPAGTTYTAVSGGTVHSVALRSDGAVLAWGQNSLGRIDVPALPAGLTYTAVSAGDSHNLALRSDGTVVAWGNSSSGQTAVPALPAGLSYTDIAAGGHHSLALRSDGALIAWGLNDLGQADVPALPDGLSYTEIGAGYLHSLALRSDGTVIAWGANDMGQTDVPALPGGTIYLAIGTGSSSLHNLALRDDGVVVAWGLNASGQTEVPDLPVGTAFTTALAAGTFHSLAITRDLAPQTVTFTSTPPALPTVGTTYQATARSVAEGGSSGNPIVYSVHTDTTGGACTVSPTGLVTFAAVGECWIQADQAGNADYAAGHAEQHVGAVKHGQSVYTNQLPGAGIAGWSTQLTAWGDTTANPITYTTTSPAVCTVTPTGYVTYKTPGTCTLELIQVGDATHHPSPSITHHIWVFGWTFGGVR